MWVVLDIDQIGSVRPRSQRIEQVVSEVVPACEPARGVGVDAKGRVDRSDLVVPTGW